jgi:DNA-binding NarL/FixJ family response regulator
VVAQGPLLRDCLRDALACAGLSTTGLNPEDDNSWDDLELFRPGVAIVYAGAGDRATAAQLTKRVLARSPNTKVLVLTDSDDERALLDAFAFGAHGFLTISSSLADADRAVRNLARSRSSADPTTIGHLTSAGVRRTADGRTSRRSASRLTQREEQVREMLADGASTDEMAMALSISPATVRRHVHNLLTKLGVHSRLEAVTTTLSTQAG